MENIKMLDPVLDLKSELDLVDNKMSILWNNVIEIDKLLIELKSEDVEEYKEFQKIKNDFNLKLDELRDKKREITNKLSKIPTISLHAKIRYLQRVCGISKKFDGKTKQDRDFSYLEYCKKELGMDDSKIRSEIFTNGNLKLIQTLKTCNLPIKNNHLALVENNTVVTIIPSGYRNFKKRRILKLDYNSIEKYKNEKKLTFS